MYAKIPKRVYETARLYLGPSKSLAIEGQSRTGWRLHKHGRSQDYRLTDDVHGSVLCVRVLYIYYNSSSTSLLISRGYGNVNRGVYTIYNLRIYCTCLCTQRRTQVMYLIKRCWMLGAGHLHRLKKKKKKRVNRLCRFKIFLSF